VRDLAGEAAARDAADPLAGWRERFHLPEPELVYLDGNSLGPLPEQTREAVRRAVDEEWGRGLVRSWDSWLHLGVEIGDVLGPLIGAEPGEVALSDQTSVDLFKLADAALGAAGGADIVTEADNFPSDRYVLAGVAARHGGRLRLVPPAPSAEDVAAVLDGGVGLVSLSLVSYRSGAFLDAAGIGEVARRHGAFTLWDLSHAAGAVPCRLRDAGADLAIGCTYKYLNGGPGAPAFLWVRRDLQDRLLQPISGWFGHRDMFGFHDTYEPAPDIRRFLTGTPPILSMVAAGEGIRLVAEAGIGAIRAKSVALTSWFIELAHEYLDGLGFTVATPEEPDRRGSHVALRHEAAWPVTQALRSLGVIVDYRTPELVRFGFSPLVNRYADVAVAIERTARVVEERRHEAFPADRGEVT